MERSEWEAEARRLEGKAREHYDAGNEELGEMYERRAGACWHNSAYGTEDGDNRQE